MEQNSNLDELENNLNMFLQTETNLDKPVRILIVRNLDNAREVAPKSPMKKDIKISFGSFEKQEQKVPFLDAVQDKNCKISFSRSVGFGTRFHLELADESSSVQQSTVVAEKKQQVVATSTNLDTEGSKTTKPWIESQSLRQKGWAVEEISRRFGSVTDKYYYHLMSGYQFRSKKQAMEFINEGTPPRKNVSKPTAHEVQVKRGKSGTEVQPDGSDDNKGKNEDALVSKNPKTSMDLGNAEGTDLAASAGKELLDQMISANQTETTQQTANDDATKESDDKVTKDTGAEHEKSSVELVLEKVNTEETEKDLATNVERGEPNVLVPNGKSIVSEVNEELTAIAGNEKTETEKISKKHPLVDDEAVTEPELKKSKIEGEQEIVNDGESSAWQRPFPPEFYDDMETYDCDPGPLWHFDDPYFIELAQVGNPPKDVAYVRLKTDKDP